MIFAAVLLHDLREDTMRFYELKCAEDIIRPVREIGFPTASVCLRRLRTTKRPGKV